MIKILVAVRNAGDMEFNSRIEAIEFLKRYIVEE